MRITLLVDDDRIDVGSTGTYKWSAFYEFDNSPFVGTILLNDTLTKNEVGKYFYTVIDINDELYGLSVFTSNTFNIVFDKVILQLSITKNRVNINESAPISWNGWYQYDMTEFKGTVSFNDSLTKNNVGKFGYRVLSIIDNLYNLTIFDTNEVSCIFDRIITRVETASIVPGSINVKISVLFEYDRSPVKEATVIVNGVEAREVTEGIYETVIHSWFPVLEINIKAKKLEFTSTTSVINYPLGNILTMILMSIVVSGAFLYVRRKTHSNNPKWSRVKNNVLLSEKTSDKSITMN